MSNPYVLSNLVANASATNPEGLAVVCDDVSVSWQELDWRVGSLAEMLAQLKVGPGDRVGVYLHKSVESLIAVHGVLRSGAAYVPLDPMATPPVLASIIADCDIGVLISGDALRPSIERLSQWTPSLPLRAVIGLSEDSLADLGVDGRGWSEVNDLSNRPPAAVGGDDLAYVMYTSGSTGKPKGIMHTHRSGSTYALAAAQMYGLSSTDRMANFSPLHFDMSTFEVLAGVAAGSSVVVLTEPILRFPASLTAHLERQQCTTWYTVPSLMQQMVTRGDLANKDLVSVRWVNPAGEVFAPDALADFMKLFPNARFSNVYGPAEVNQCTYYHFDKPPTDGKPVPLGLNWDRSELLVVDDELEPLGIVGDPAANTDGQKGELLVRTATMMAGYWNRPDLDEKVFVEREGENGQRHRWFRTGDLVEIDQDGLLRFHGRRDHQVKVRGYRVELESVESAVGDLIGVENAVAGALVDAAGMTQLVVAFTSADDQVDTASWRKQLTGSLASYAVPASFARVDAFPQTPSGKIDRRTVREKVIPRMFGDPD